MFKQVPRKFSVAHTHVSSKKMSLNIPATPQRYNDYLHPKYSLPPVKIDIGEVQRYNDYLHPKNSLPPVKIDIGEVQWEFEQLLRTPGRAVRASTSPKPGQTPCKEI
ncbi:hypothetical protein OESDEN_18195 [Oesophagostomum dentatum]|uniref:Uncharacterized protein n=1 Tax=Oesophagostomum dentatum TaxID=61180 RepID=A0A0B1SA09_OESDE|nr:hypothetical protein OESDEN_18195 [Oesophagostomum dentatum]